jgi:hypothetical protein
MRSDFLNCFLSLYRLQRDSGFHLCAEAPPLPTAGGTPRKVREYGKQRAGGTFSIFLRVRFGPMSRSQTFPTFASAAPALTAPDLPWLCARNHTTSGSSDGIPPRPVDRLVAASGGAAKLITIYVWQPSIVGRFKITYKSNVKNVWLEPKYQSLTSRVASGFSQRTVTDWDSITSSILW